MIKEEGGNLILQLLVMLGAPQGQLADDIMMSVFMQKVSSKTYSPSLGFFFCWEGFDWYFECECKQPRKSLESTIGCESLGQLDLDYPQGHVLPIHQFLGCGHQR